jgi:hypothetical protein
MRLPQNREEWAARGAIKDALDACRGTSDYSAVREAIAAYLQARLQAPESVTKNPATIQR